MLSERPVWIARNPALRRAAVHAWRKLLRMQRATFANAVLVIRNKHGRILVVRSPSGELGLPAKVLDAWLPIATQVEDWLEEMLQQRSTPSLVAIDGTPSREGVTFLYSATLEALVEGEDKLWLEPDVAGAVLGRHDNRLLLLCAEQGSQLGTSQIEQRAYSGHKGAQGHNAGRSREMGQRWSGRR